MPSGRGVIGEEQVGPLRLSSPDAIIRTRRTRTLPIRAIVYVELVWVAPNSFHEKAGECQAFL